MLICRHGIVGKKNLVDINFLPLLPTYSTVRVINISRIEEVGNKTHGITLAVKGIIKLTVFVERAKRAPHWGVQSRFRVIYI